MHSAVSKTKRDGGPATAGPRGGSELAQGGAGAGGADREPACARPPKGRRLAQTAGA